MQLSDREVHLIKLCMRRAGVLIPTQTIRGWPDYDLDKALTWADEEYEATPESPVAKPGCIMRALADHRGEYGIVVQGKIDPYQRVLTKGVAKDIYKPKTIIIPDAIDEGMGSDKYMIMRILVNGRECLNSPVDAASFAPQQTNYPDGYPLPLVEDGQEIAIEVLSNLSLPVFFRAQVPGVIVRFTKDIG